MKAAPSYSTFFTAKIPGAVLSPIHNGWIFPRAATPPALELAVGSALYAVRAPSFVYDGVDSGEADGSELAYGAIQSNGGSQVLVFGDAFFHVSPPSQSPKDDADALSWDFRVYMVSCEISEHFELSSLFPFGPQSSSTMGRSELDALRSFTEVEWTDTAWEDRVSEA